MSVEMDAFASRSAKEIIFLLTLFVVAMMTKGDVPRPRGVSLVKASLYQPRSDQTWVCLDGSKTIRYVQVNDDYCDCADGSDEPGTAACNHGQFHCKNEGHKPQDIPSSRVNDGICDCCDGSDEWDEGAGNCQDVCQELGRAAEEQRRNEVELHKRGSAKRSELMAKGKQLRIERELRRQELERQRSEQEALKTEKEELKRQAEAAEAEALELYREQQREQAAPDAEAAKAKEDSQDLLIEAQQAFIRYDVNNDGFVEVTELQVDMTLDRDRNGVVTVEEAKYFLDERDRIDLDAFLTLSWPRLKPMQMLAQGLFQPPTKEGEEEEEGGQQQQADKPTPLPIVEGTEEQETGDGYEHAETEGEEEGEEEEVYEDEDVDGGVVPAPTVTTVQAEYDPETQHLIELANEARNAYAEVERKIREIEHEIKEIDEQNNKDYGPNEEYAALDGECYTYDDREYVYTLCPFDRASQKQRSGGAETTLGRWDQWIGEGDNKYSKQKYAHGAACWNGPQRSAIVQLKCAVEHKITSVTEPNRCEYNFVFETPTACDGLTEEDTEMHDEL